MERKRFAGPRVRRLRLGLGLTQTRMAEDLGLSVSYLNLVERNQRPLTATFLLRLSQVYNVDLRQLAADEGGPLADEVTALLADPLFDGIDIGRGEIADFVASCPGIAAALARLHGAFTALPARPDAGAATETPLETVRAYMQGQQNHFADIDARAEALADELRLATGDLFSALGERLRVRHGFTVRILPADVMPLLLRRLDLHSRQLQVSEVLDQASRTFETAYQLALVEARDPLQAQVEAARIDDPAARRLLLHNLASYFAAAVMMPYGRFIAACEASGYDLELLQARFGAGFEQVAHRLTTLQRPGARGIPFFMVRTDRAGNISKRYAAGRFPFTRSGGRCPLWSLHAAFDRPGQLLVQLIALEDDSRYLSIARTVRSYAMPYGGVRPEFAVGIGCEVEHARGLVYARGRDVGPESATPVGIGCAACNRLECRQRSVPPAGHTLLIDERQRGPTPFSFGAG